jgi:putative ABC transport system permease protein
MTLTILGVALPIFILSTLYDAMEPTYGYLRFLSTVAPAVGEGVDPAVASQLRNHPTVRQVIPSIQQELRVDVPPAGSAGVAIFGVPEDSLAPLMTAMGMELVAGRLPQPRTNEIVISRSVARNRNLDIGDTLGGLHEENDEALLRGSDDLPAGAVLVGLLGSDDLWLGFASLEYLLGHELLNSRPTQMLVVTDGNNKATLDAWLEQNIASDSTIVNTHGSVAQFFGESRRDLLVLIAAVESIIALVAAIAVAALNAIFFSQRRSEFGILNAIGHSRPWLLLRTAKETGSVILIAWLLGAFLCAAGLVLTQTAIYEPRGLSLNFDNPLPWLFTLPIPIAVVTVSTGTIARALTRIDPVSVVEGRL